MVVGRTTTDYLRLGEEEYARRLQRYLPFEQVVIPDVRTTRALTEERQKQQEGQAMLAKVAAGDILVLLDEHGREMTSRELAGFLQKRLAAGASKNLVFAVGGPYGFSPEVYARADFKLSLSRLTFPHEMVRLLFTEQLYRAMTILRNEPYHHD